MHGMGRGRKKGREGKKERVGGEREGGKLKMF